MARTTTKKTTTVQPEIIEEISEELVEEVIEKPKKTIVKKEKKKFALDDGILCRSITAGGLYMPGKKSQILYRWSNEGDITEVEYQDLLAEVRSSSIYITAPRFIIEDEDFLEQNPRLKTIYETMYDISDFREMIMESSADGLIQTIKRLPTGAQESVKHVASDLVTNGFLDSISKIRALDEYYNTNLKLLAGF